MRAMPFVFVALALFGGPLLAEDATPASTPPMTPPLTSMSLSDGSIATSSAHCGDTDLCATVTYLNGDKLSIYSEGAAYCQPYILHFVRVNGPRTIYEYSREINHDRVTSTAFGTSCGHSQTTQMVMDHGLVHLTVDENHDGTLNLVFTR